MRKSMVVGTVSLAIALAIPHHATAQQSMAGVKGGFVSANVSVDDPTGEDLDTDARSAIGGGVFFQAQLGESFSVQPEILYVLKGFGAPIEGVDVSVKTNYIQVPILIQYHLPTNSTVSPRLFLGPSIALQTSCDAEATVQGESLEASCEEADIVVTKDADFSAVFGAGVDIAVGSVIVTFDGRYDLGFTNLLTEGDGEVKTRALEFFAGVGIPFGP